MIFPSDWNQPAFREVPGICFACGSQVSREEPNVVWHGWGAVIVAHPSCAQTLGCDLIKHSREAELAAGTAWHWTKRVRRAALAADGFSMGEATS